MSMISFGGSRIVIPRTFCLLSIIRYLFWSSASTHFTPVMHLFINLSRYSVARLPSYLEIYTILILSLLCLTKSGPPLPFFLPLKTVRSSRFVTDILSVCDRLEDCRSVCDRRLWSRRSAGVAVWLPTLLAAGPGIVARAQELFLLYTLYFDL